MEGVTWGDVVKTAAEGNIEEAIGKCHAYWEKTGGPPAAASVEEDVRAFTRYLNVWQQIRLFVDEVDRRPHNARTWKLLAYAYMWAGVYIPALLRAAEQAFLVSSAHEEQPSVQEVLEEKIEIIKKVLAGDKDARAELALAERAFAAPFDAFPEDVPMPRVFITMGLVNQPSLIVTMASLAPDLRALLDG